jgi:hypothetical protein
VVSTPEWNVFRLAHILRWRGALRRGVGVEQLADGGDDGVEGSRSRLAQKMLELGEDLLDRIKARRFANLSALPEQNCSSSPNTRPI